MIKSCNYCGVLYTAEKTGYGHLIFTKHLKSGIIEIHSTDSLTYDWMDDPEQNIMFKTARKRLQTMFKNHKP